MNYRENWLSEENLNKAKGKTRAELFNEFGNTLEPIAYIDPAYLPYLGDNIIDNRVYSGKGYFIDHAVNHHPEVKIEDYDNIQEILNNPDDVLLDNRTQNKRAIVFIKKFDNYYSVVVGVSDEKSSKIVIYKTYNYKHKKPYASLPSIRLDFHW
jgi:hypothetical protein